jgi:hypothetical protein
VLERIANTTTRRPVYFVVTSIATCSQFGALSISNVRRSFELSFVITWLSIASRSKRCIFWKAFLYRLQCTFCPFLQSGFKLCSNQYGYTQKFRISCRPQVVSACLLCYNDQYSLFEVMRGRTFHVVHVLVSLTQGDDMR